mmetsp:Transcript_104662/g.180425  ORF Transcript_104662/g.180425 Transcript_104662/m.180425 type:complete len:243 (+) Transcript_104662:2497-3225(+)
MHSSAASNGPRSCRDTDTTFLCSFFSEESSSETSIASPSVPSGMPIGWTSTCTTAWAARILLVDRLLIDGGYTLLARTTGGLGARVFGTLLCASTRTSSLGRGWSLYVVEATMGWDVMFGTVAEGMILGATDSSIGVHAASHVRLGAGLDMGTTSTFANPGATGLPVSIATGGSTGCGGPHSASVNWSVVGLMATQRSTPTAIFCSTERPVLLLVVATSRACPGGSDANEGAMSGTVGCLTS